MFTGFIHDLSDRIIAETDSSGTTQREYIWADDIPIAVFDTVATSPTLYLVHTDHLMRPVRMTNQWGGLAWDVLYRPFGEVNNISEIVTTSDMRFPGQSCWRRAESVPCHGFQLQNGLAFNYKDRNHLTAASPPFAATSPHPPVLPGDGGCGAVYRGA